jgi:hypothetical protein
MSRKINVFISHSWQHTDDLKNLKSLLENRVYFNVEFKQVEPENPINSERAAYIKSVLKRNIEESNVVLGIAGIYASYSEWMDWELSTALKLGIKVVGVIPRGQERVSQTVTKYSSENVRWNTESIVDAIRRNSNI